MRNDSVEESGKVKLLWRGNQQADKEGKKGSEMHSFRSSTSADQTLPPIMLL